MSRLEELPPDQRAALSLLMRQRKSYAQVAEMLGIAEQAVHDRAHAALAILAPRQARELEHKHRQEVGNYLLGQQASVAERLRTRTLLSSSPPAGAWAQAVAGELTGIGGVEMPDIPRVVASAAAVKSALAAGTGSSIPAATAAAQPAQTAPYTLAQAAAASSSSSSASSSSPDAFGQRPPAGRQSSRKGGALLLGAIVIAVVVIVIVASGGGGSHKKSPTTASTSTGTSSSPKQQGRFTLKAPGKSSSAGTVEILSEEGKNAFYIQAEHIPATKHFFYAIWLYNSPSSALPLSKSPPVGKSHKLAGAALLPSNAGSFKEILLTRETSTHPTHPGHVVLRGPFSLKG